MMASVQTWGASIGFLVAQGQGNQPSGGGLMIFVPLIVMAVFWYLLIIRPQQRERARREEMLKALKKNDRVVTTSGMLGSVANISQDGKEVTLKFGDSTRIPFLRAAVERVVTPETDEKETSAKS